MAREARPFVPGAPRLWTIPAGAPFLSQLAAQLIASFALPHNPQALSEMIIYLPNRRSARTLSIELFRQMGGKAVIMPDIRTLGDTEAGEALSISDAGRMDLLPPLDETRTIGVLVELVTRYYQTAHEQAIPASLALSAARELMRLLDQASLGAGARWNELESLVEAPDLAAHWKKSTEFLTIVTKWWPEWLREQKAGDPFQHQLKLAEAVAQRWRASPPAGPILIAGSTGATAAGRILMQAAINLEKGAVILPGLDKTLTPAMRSEVLAAPSHPQNTLLLTLNALGAAPADVADWPGKEEPETLRARRHLINTALAPAEMTSDWRETLQELACSVEEADKSVGAFLDSALSGLSLLALPDETSEALAAALLMRETLTVAGKTAALVTPDASLARRVAAELLRWGITVPPSAGEPLGRTPCGSFISICARLAADPADPELLAALLKHPYVPLPPEAALLDLHFLRLPRNWRSLDDLAQRIIHLAEKASKHAAYTPEEARQAANCVQEISVRVTAGCEGFSCVESSDTATIARQVAALATSLAGEQVPWRGEDGRSCAALLDRLATMSCHFPPISAPAFADLLDAEMALVTVPSEAPEHSRLKILGPLEARLQSADRIILAGLNEGTWPQRPPADSFLPRRFRRQLGLMDPDERVGLAAHDFAMLAAAPEVILTYAKRREDAPAVASRWVWRLQTLVRGALVERTDEVLCGQEGWAADLVSRIKQDGQDALPRDFSAKPLPRRRPEAWPHGLSVTRVDRLQRDPYGLWAEQVLGLRTVDPLGTGPSAMHRGTAVHLALERFEEPGREKTAEVFLELLQGALKEAGEPVENWLGSLAIWKATAEWFVDWRRQRDVPGEPYLERSGNLVLDIAGEPFKLSATADRIERDANGSLHIVDFKTGSPPTDKMIRQGFDPQLPLEALIAKRGGFDGIAASEVASLEYVALKATPEFRIVGRSRDFNATAAEMAEKAEAGLINLIASYRDPEAVFLSAPRIQYVKYDYGYNLLARRAEWTSEMEAEGDG
jgi:ATP-dependent helicase/nuclease subunit B